MKRISVFVLLYGAIHFVSDKISSTLQLPNIIGCVGIAFYFLMLLRYLHKNGNLKKVRICLPNHFLRSAMIVAPLALLPICNFIHVANGLTTFSLNCYVAVEAVLTCFSAFGEELLFRSALPIAIAKKYAINKISSVMISCIGFSLLHFVNIASGLSFMKCCVQIAYAFGVGLSFAAVTEKTKSIFPSTVIHAFINLSSANTEYVDQENAEYWFLFLIMGTLSGCYGLWLFYRKEKGNN